MKGLEERRKKLAEAKEREREMAAVPEQLHEELRRLEAEIAEQAWPIDGSAPPAGSEARVVWDGWTEVKAKLDGPWAARVAGARQEVERCRSALNRYVDENLGELVAEVEPEAAAARDAVREKVDELAAAIDRWHEVRSRVSSLLSFAQGISGADIPRPPFDPPRATPSAGRGDPGPVAEQPLRFGGRGRPGGSGGRGGGDER